MFYEEFVLTPEETDFKACYLTGDGKIVYNLPFMYNFSDWSKTITHEWLHGLIDWALEGDEGKPYKDTHDETGEGDHYIMRSIGYDDFDV